MAQWTEEFESEKPTWFLGETDCIIPKKSWVQRRTPDEAHAGQKCESIYFETGNGTKVLIAHDIEPSKIISELTPSVWVKGSRPNIQMYARVVLPDTPSPDGDGPMTALLPGPVYQLAGQWQQLSFADAKYDLPTLMFDQLAMLRRVYGSSVSDAGAYVDKIVLNIFTGAGSSTVWIDDLVINGAVSTSLDPPTPELDPTMVQQATFESEQEQAASITEIDGTVIQVSGVPFFARIIRHNGEPFEMLQQLGFNVIELPTTATYQQLRTAERLGIWIVCPPPANVGLMPIGVRYDRVLCWMLGENLTARDVDRIERYVREIKSSEFRDGRPLVGEVAADWSVYGQFLDLLVTGQNSIGTSFPMSDYAQWLKTREQLAKRPLPIWANVQTELPPSLVEQVSVMAGGVPPLPVEHQQLKSMVYEAITGGARGAEISIHYSPGRGRSSNASSRFDTAVGQRTFNAAGIVGSRGYSRR